MEEEYIKTITDAASVKAPESNYPAISAMYDSSYQAMAGESAIKGATGRAGDIMQQRRAAAAAAAAARNASVSRRKAELAAQLDPKKYRIIKNMDGTQYYINSQDQEIPFPQWWKERVELAQLTGVTIDYPWPEDILSKAQTLSGEEQQFMYASSRLTKLANIVENSSGTIDANDEATWPTDMKNWVIANQAMISTEDFRKILTNPNAIAQTLVDNFPNIYSIAPEPTIPVVE